MRLFVNLWRACIRMWHHIIHFWPIMIAILLMIVAVFIAQSGNWPLYKVLSGISLIWILLLLCIRPLNAVYGLMGTSGSVNVFFINLILLCFVFSGIYYWGFFKTAGISYDVNQPHVDYQMFVDTTAPRFQLSDAWKKHFRDSVVSRPINESLEITYVFDKDGKTIVDTLYQAKPEELYYQSIDFPTVLRNTALTFLMQEPTDLFATATNYNAGLSGKGQTIDKQKTEQIHWILIFQVLVGWIFFGVFISILYNKFRYES